MDIKVHCVVSCLCDALKRAGIDHRPFYFGVWDADFAVGADWTLRYHAPGVTHDFFCRWYHRLYGAEPREWYDRGKGKPENLAVLLDLVERRSDTLNVMAMVDLFHLPERENKFNQNPFPHYLMLETSADPTMFFVSDPDFRWEGEIERDKVVNAFCQPTVGGGYVFDRRDLRPARPADLKAYFEACFRPDANPLTDAVGRIVTSHLAGADGRTIADLPAALRELPVISIRKYAYEHGFAFFWRALGLPDDGFLARCDEIEELVQGFKTLHFAVLRLGQTGDTAVAAILVAQRQLMQQRQDALAHKRTLLLQKIAQINEEIAGLRAQVTSQSRQLTLIAEEVKGVTHLLNKGLERKPRLLALQRSQAEIAGLRAANEAAIARALQAIGEAEQQITTLDAERQEEIGTRLAEVTGELAAARDRLVAAADVLRRVVITAPIAGTVVQLKAHTVGGVVGSGQPILDIVPRDEDLLIDARIAPTDIDVVREGLPAQVVLSAYKQRNLPRLEGRVRSVSADRIVDEKTSTPYYLVRIEVDREHLAKVAPDVELTPGMPAEAMVMTGHRTALSYLTQPFLDSLRRSMRES